MWGVEDAVSPSWQTALLFRGHCGIVWALNRRNMRVHCWTSLKLTMWWWNVMLPPNIQVHQSHRHALHQPRGYTAGGLAVENRMNLGQHYHVGLGYWSHDPLSARTCSVLETIHWSAAFFQVASQKSASHPNRGTG